MELIIYAMLGALAVIVGILLANIQLKNEGFSENTVIVTAPSNKDKGSENDYSGSSNFWLKLSIIVVIIVAVVFGVVIIDFLLQQPSAVNISVE